MNVMKMAWKIFLNKKRVYTFSTALKLAWRLCRVAKVEIINGYLEIKSKAIALLGLFMVDSMRGGIKVKDEQYSLNILFYQLNHI